MLTKKVPCHNLMYDHQVMKVLMDGQFPSTPIEFATQNRTERSLRCLCNNCWRQDPLLLSEVDKLVQALDWVRASVELPQLNVVTCSTKPSSSAGANSSPTAKPHAYETTGVWRAASTPTVAVVSSPFTSRRTRSGPYTWPSRLSNAE